MKKRICTLALLLLLMQCRQEIAHSASAHWLALPAELHGEVQGMPAHWSVQGRGGAVSSANALATAAGIEALKRGGNAIDALLAVQWVLGVVEPQSSGLGGGGFLLYYEAKTGRVYALDGREEQPEKAPANLFLGSDGKPLSFVARIAGARAVGVPGTVALLDLAYRRFASNRLSWGTSFERAISLAKNGIRVSPRLSQAMQLNRERLIAQNGHASLYLQNGRAYNVGEVLYQPDLTSTLQRLAQKGAQDFYTGAIAADIVATCRSNPVYASAMMMSDLGAYRAVERPVIVQRASSAALYSVGAPTSGKTTLDILQAAALTRGSETDLIMRSLKAGKVAFAERERVLEDPDFAAARAPGPAVHEAQNTTHVSIIDGAGNAVSYTSSVETGMGSALVVRGRGFLLNNQLSDFAAEPGKVNSPESGHRVRSTALNAEARLPGGKRPRSSMSPVIIKSADGSLTALGSPGGATIVGTVALTGARILAGNELQQALNAPRAIMMPHGKALVELPLKRDRQFLARLKGAGIEADLRRNVISLGSVQAVQCTREHFCIAASDLRREGLGLVVEPGVD